MEGIIQELGIRIKSVIKHFAGDVQFVSDFDEMVTIMFERQEQEALEELDDDDLENMYGDFAFEELYIESI